MSKHVWDRLGEFAIDDLGLDDDELKLLLRQLVNKIAHQAVETFLNDPNVYTIVLGNDKIEVGSKEIGKTIAVDWDNVSFEDKHPLSEIEARFKDRLEAEKEYRGVDDEEGSGSPPLPAAQRPAEKDR